MGYNGDCRDYLYYKDAFHKIGQDDRKCDFAGEYFSNRYGKIFNDHIDIVVFKCHDQEKKQKTRI